MKCGIPVKATGSHGLVIMQAASIGGGLTLGGPTEWQPQNRAISRAKRRQRLVRAWLLGFRHQPPHSQSTYLTHLDRCHHPPRTTLGSLTPAAPLGHLFPMTKRPGQRTAAADVTMVSARADSDNNGQAATIRAESPCSWAPLGALPPARV